METVVCVAVINRIYFDLITSVSAVLFSVVSVFQLRPARLRSVSSSMIFLRRI